MDADRRAVVDRYRAVTADWERTRDEWVKVHRLPGEPLPSAWRRFMALRMTRNRADLKKGVADLVRKNPSLAATPPTSPAWADDGQQDALWALDHSTRRFRVRPVRAHDLAWWATGPGVTVIDTQTLERIVVPVDGALTPADTDAFGSAIFIMRDAWNAKHGNA